MVIGKDKTQVADEGSRTLLAPVPREPVHNRDVMMRGFKREDGLWDIEGELRDTKAAPWPSFERGTEPPSAAVHHMIVRLTVDDKFFVRELSVALPAVPFNECNQGVPPMNSLVGACLMRGWRQEIQKSLGLALGCAHLRELLVSLATVAFQTIEGEKRRQRWEKLALAEGETPIETTIQPHWGKCIAWKMDGTVIERFAPSFHQGVNQK